MKQNFLKITLNIARTIAVAVPFIWILSKIEADKLILALGGLRWWTIPLYLTIVFVCIFLQGLRWWILLRAFDDKLSFKQSISCHLKSLFYSIVLPGSTSQEIIRTLFVTRKTGASIGWSTAWICKITGVIISLATSFYGLFLLSGTAFSATAFKAVFILFLLICILVAVSFSKKLTAPLRNLSRKIVPHRYLSKAENLREGIYQFRYKKKSVLLSAIITLITQLFLISGPILLIESITGSIYIKECFAFIPIIEIISMAQPFTPNGMGVREALTAVMFKHLRFSSEQLGVYILIGNLSILAKFVGALPVLYGIIFRRGSGRKEKYTARPENQDCAP